MNIKGLTPNSIALDPRVRVDDKESVRTKNSSERDADGHRQQAEPENKRHLNEEEFSEAIKVLKENQGVVANGLMVRVETLEGHRVIFVEDLQGKVIRRLSEADLWLVTRERARPTGKILDKAG